MESEFDVVVVGAGPSGEVAAGRLADAGLEVALCERHLVGGECSFYACMPSKALVRPAELIGEVGRVPGVELASDEPTPEKVLARRDEVIHGLDDSAQLPWLKEREHQALPGRGKARRGAPRSSGRRRPGRAQGRDRRHRHGPIPPSHPRPGRGEPMDQPRGHDRKRGSREPDRDRRRPSRLRARAGMALAGRRRRAPRGSPRALSRARRSSPPRRWRRRWSRRASTCAPTRQIANAAGEDGPGPHHLRGRSDDRGRASHGRRRPAAQQRRHRARNRRTQGGRVDRGRRPASR